MFHFFYDYEEISQSYPMTYGVELNDEYLETLDYIDLYVNITGIEKGLLGNLFRIRSKGRNDHKQPQDQRMKLDEKQLYRQLELPVNIEYEIYRLSKKESEER